MTDAATRHLADRMLSDVHFLLDQGLIQKDQATTMRSILQPLIIAVKPQQQQTRLAPGTGIISKSDKVPPPPPTSASSAAASRTRIHQPLPSASLQQQQQQQPQDHRHQEPAQQDDKQHQQQHNEWVKALWDFDASGGDDELKFQVGQEIRILQRVDQNWWKGVIPPVQGTKERERVGLFPAAYVQPLVLFPPPPTATPFTTSTPRPPTAQAKQWSAPKARFSSSPLAVGVALSPPAYGSSAVTETTTTSSSGSASEHNYPHRQPAGLQTVVNPTAAGGGGGGAAADGEEGKTADKGQGQMKKLLKTPVGTAIASGVGFGVGASLVSSIL